MRLQQKSTGFVSALPGVKAERENLSGCAVTAVEILDQRGVKALGKPPGRYYTLELPKMRERASTEQCAIALSTLLLRCMNPEQKGLILIAALGNPDITPDAIGALTAQNLLVTRHLKLQAPRTFEAFRPTALCRTGVLGTSGLESAEQLRCLCATLHPDFLIAVDALAGSEIHDLCHCIQICNTGIAPGSGVGNNRKELTEQTMGVPVLAIGVPTVIDASALSRETGLDAMFVTPRDIDAAVRRVSQIIGYGINLALHPGLSLAEMIDLLD